MKRNSKKYTKNSINNSKFKLDKKIIVVGGFLIIVISFIALFMIIKNYSSLMGNSVSYYSCPDNTYIIQDNSCIKTITSDSLLLGDVNVDYKVDIEDLNLLRDYLDNEDTNNAIKLRDEQIISSDINGNKEIDEIDYTILKNYLERIPSTYSIYYEKIGVDRLCLNDYELNGNKCEHKEVLSALNNNKVVESVGANSNEKKFTIIFNPNGGTGNMKDIVVNFGYPKKLTKNSYINANKKFLGWNVYNDTRKLWLCYTTNRKQNDADHQKYMPENKCSYGKSLYKDEATISKTTTINDERLIFYAVWDDKEENSVSVNFNYNQNSSTLKYKTLVIITPEFSVAGSKQYYYKWNTYIYDKIHYSSPCQKVPNGKAGIKSLDMTGDRQGGIQIYSDANCKNKVDNEYKTSKYYCTGCSPVKVNFVQATRNTYKKGEVVKSNIQFQIDDSTRTYYYNWNVNQDNKWVSKTSCKKIVNGNTIENLTISGNTKGRISIYKDSSCKNSVNSYDTQTFICSNCSNSENNKQFTIKYNSNGGSGSVNTQKVTYGVSTKLNDNKFSKNNYYHVGWRVYNNDRKKWACYKNSSKTSQGYTTNDDCKKYGYVIYKNKQSISKTANVGETITMYALWQYSYKKTSGSFSGFERDPKGATVWPMVKIDIYKNSNGTNKIGTIPQGTALKVLDMTNKNNSKNSYVKIKYSGKEGYINGWLTMINLPDVIPSALYNITNASASIFKSRQYTLSGVTGKDIYGGDWKSSMAPIRIETAKKIQAVQSLAKKYGNKIKIYDSFRPWVVQRKVSDAVKDNWFTGKGYTITNDFDSSKNTNGPGQTHISDYKGWFIASATSAPSSHNVAKAIDVTLVFSDDNQEIPTQSPMHELSGNSIPTKTQVNNNKGELALNYLFTNSGFKFLPSEWWHFEDTQNTNYSNYSSQIKCLGNPYASNKYNCKVNQIKLAK